MFGQVPEQLKNDTVELGSIAEMLSGGTPSSKHPEYYGDKYPFVTTPCLGANYISEKDAITWLSEIGVENSSTHIIPAYSIMYGSRVGVGKSSINTCDMCTNQDILSFYSIDTSKYNLLFIKTVMDQYFDFIDAQKRGSTIKGVTSDIVRGIKIPNVPIEVQKQFASFTKQSDKSKLIEVTNINNIYEKLTDKDIIAILDGDTDFGKITFEDYQKDIDVSMPYLSGPDICGIACKFGMDMEYSWGGGNLSRWAYFENLLVYCIENNKIQNLLSFLFSKGQFVKKLKGHSADVIDSSYNQIVNTVIKEISGLLYFDGYEFVNVTNQFIIKKINEDIVVETPTFRVVNREYIVDLSERAMRDIDEGHYDSAITKSRTLLEEVFCYVIEKKSIKPSESGDIGKLYAQVKDIYNMHADKDMDKRINMLLSGLEKIVRSIAEMRNEASDSHGVGSRRINISEHHARLFVNSAKTMADFILSVSQNQK